MTNRSTRLSLFGTKGGNTLSVKLSEHEWNNWCWTLNFHLMMHFIVPGAKDFFVTCCRHHQFCRRTTCFTLNVVNGTNGFWKASSTLHWCLLQEDTKPISKTKDVFDRGANKHWMFTCTWEFLNMGRRKPKNVGLNQFARSDWHQFSNLPLHTLIVQTSVPTFTQCRYVHMCLNLDNKVSVIIYKLYKFH